MSEETVLKMRSESSEHKKEFEPGQVWGLGMRVIKTPVYKEHPLSPGTYGWSGAFGTHFFIDVEKNIQVVLMMNRSNIGGAASYISREVEKRVYEVFE